MHNAVAAAQSAKSKRAAVELLAPALSGSCALLSFYDARTQLLRVACTGDSRAVLGTRSASGAGRWVATPLSEDQTGGTPSEAARLRVEHPGEEYVTHRGRILGGLEPSRAFGDAVYKWSRDTAMLVRGKFLGKNPPSLSRTPPYVTAEPVVTTTRVSPGQGDFVVLATDGLWECLTNEEVVGLVGRWLDAQPASALPGRDGSSAKAATTGGGLLGGLSGWFGPGTGGALPVEGHDARGPSATPVKGGEGNTDEGQRLPIRQNQWAIGVGDERFVVEDENAATHLIRNALGGRDRDMVCALLSLPSPYSRRYRYVMFHDTTVFAKLERLTDERRDDLTVQVIFFGDGRRHGQREHHAQHGGHGTEPGRAAEAVTGGPFSHLIKTLYFGSMRERGGLPGEMGRGMVSIRSGYPNNKVISCLTEDTAAVAYLHCIQTYQPPYFALFILVYIVTP